MKTLFETRMHCLSMAVSLAISKSIATKDVLPTAMEFFRWLDNDPDAKADLEPLRKRFER